MRSGLLLVILVGCGGKKDSGPSCDQVVDHMLEVTKQQLMGHETANLKSQRKAMVSQCENRNMSGEMRTCLVGAQTITEIARCRGGKTDVLEKQRKPRVGSGSATVVTPPPTTQTGSGSAGTAHGSSASSGH